MDSEIGLEPLVSIVVITYNSSEFIIETLESCKNQSYKNIELIISDDASNDNTVRICQNWLRNNAKYFERVELITSSHNRGISANCNNGIHSTRGEWIKIIAGDDILKKDALKNYLKFINNNDTEDVLLVYSSLQPFKSVFSEENIMPLKSRRFNFFANSSAKKQYSLLLRTNSFVQSPTLFYHKSVFQITKVFDETMPIEDWPALLNVTKNNIKLHYLNRITVYYRIHEKSFYNGSKHTKEFKKNRKLFYEEYVINNITLIERIIYYFSKKIYQKMSNKIIYLIALFRK